MPQLSMRLINQHIVFNFKNHIKNSMAKSCEFNLVFLHYKITNELAKTEPVWVKKKEK